MLKLLPMIVTLGHIETMLRLLLSGKAEHGSLMLHLRRAVPTSRKPLRSSVQLASLI